MTAGVVLLIVVIGFTVAIGGFVWVTYNSLIALQRITTESWHQIDVELQRRYDLIPNLVETVKGYMHHEHATLQSVIEARNAAFAVKNAPVGDRVQAENILTDALGKLMAVSEAYPDLKADQSVAQLMNAVSDTEDRLAASRRIYTQNVRVLDVKVHQFPGNLVANQFGLNDVPAYFEVTDPTVRANPRVTFTATP